MKQAILLVEDNEHIMKINRDTLEEEGYLVLEAYNVEEARRVLKTRHPHLIVLDIMLPDGSGTDFCREVKEQEDIPILFLSAKSSNSEIVSGLRSGGDDYLTKPYDLDVMLARIEALLRRSDRMQKELRLDELCFSILSGKAYLKGEDLLLTQKEFSVLLLLAQNLGTDVSKETIFQEVWGCSINHDCQALWVTVSRLKKKLFDSQFRIMGMRFGGYRLERKPYLSEL